MSYDIDLVDPITKETLQLDSPHHMKGGNYVLGGTTEASLNVTYNYAPRFHRVFESLDKPRPNAPDWMFKHGDDSQIRGIRTLYGLTGAESLPVLDRAISMLGDDVHPDYWKPTDGNAKRALTQLRALASMRPDGVWSGD